MWDDVQIGELRGRDEIADALARLGGSLFDQSVNTETRLGALAAKYGASATVLAARCGSRLVGLCAFYDNGDAGGTAFVSMLVVDGEWQGRGCGTLLMREVIRRCAGRRLSLEVSRRNAPAIRLYERMGLRPFRKRGDSIVYAMDVGD